MVDSGVILVRLWSSVAVHQKDHGEFQSLAFVDGHQLHTMVPLQGNGYVVNLSLVVHLLLQGLDKGGQTVALGVRLGCQMEELVVEGGVLQRRLLLLGLVVVAQLVPQVAHQLRDGHGEGFGCQLVVDLAATDKGRCLLLVGKEQAILLVEDGVGAIGLAGVPRVCLGCQAGALGGCVGCQKNF